MVYVQGSNMGVWLCLRKMNVVMIKINETGVFGFYMKVYVEGKVFGYD